MSRATATASCRRSRSGAAAPGARAPARCTRRSRSSRTRGAVRGGAPPAQLEDEGRARAETADGGRVFTLTDKGKEAVAERDDATPAPWETFDEEAGTGHREFRRSIGELAGAAQMVFRAGDEGQRARAAE